MTFKKKISSFVQNTSISTRLLMMIYVTSTKHKRGTILKIYRKIKQHKNTVQIKNPRFKQNEKKDTNYYDKEKEGRVIF